MSALAHSYAPRAIRSRRHRRTKPQIRAIRDSIRETLEDMHPQTVRGLFYQLVTRGLVEKSESEYKTTIVRLLAAMRRAGEIPYEWISDESRWMRKPETFDSYGEALRRTAANYRRDLWADQPVYVEIWCEKEALAGLIVEETWTYDVPLLVSKGFSSLSYLHSAAKQIEAHEKVAYVYHFGDHDPSGIAIAKRVELELRRMAPDTEIHFERVAVTKEQIRRLRLPTRPTKKSDTRAKKFRGRSVELDAIAPDELQRLVRGCIEQHIDGRVLARTKRIEEMERETLTNLIGAEAGV